MHALEGLLHDAASLQRFVEFVKDFCEEQQRSQTYIDSSRRFLSYVANLGEQTIGYLQSFVHERRTAPLWPRAQRQKIVVIKKFWRLLHEFVKPSTDADTLRIPVSLLLQLNDQLRGLRGLETAQIVTLLSPRLNYFQYRHGNLKSLARDLKSILQIEEDFPPGLGFIAIPYSQGSGLFTNILIYHELGHFVFEELCKGPKLLGDIDQSLRNADPAFGAASKQLQSWCRDRLQLWAEEIYCDLFALWLIGPAFSFASIELFSLLGLLEPEASLRFNLSHPSDACRFKEHLIQLKEHDWWGAIGGLTTEHVSLIQSLGERPDDMYSFPVQENPALGGMLVRAFLEIRQSIRDLVKETLDGVGTGLVDFKAWNEEIRDCLRHGIVPSRMTAEGTSLAPPPVATINASFCFYLESINELARKTKGYQVDNVANRSKLTKLVELWALKAIEDYRLLSRQKSRN